MSHFTINSSKNEFNNTSEFLNQQNSCYNQFLRVVFYCRFDTSINSSAFFCWQIRLQEVFNV